MQLQLQHLGNLEIAASSRNLETDPVSSVRQWVRNISFEVAHGPVMAWALPKISHRLVWVECGWLCT